MSRRSSTNKRSLGGTKSYMISEIGMRFQLLSNLIRRSPLRWHIANKVTRMEVIQRVITMLRAKTYLEIGVSDGTCFCMLNAPEKIGVDPIAPSAAVLIEMEKPGVHYFANSSDEFFQNAASRVLGGGVDVVFVDGLHIFEQAYRDCMTSLKYLKPGGLILLHDCLPTSELEARVAESYEDAARLNAAFAWNRAWVGDVWKAILKLRSQHMDLQTCVLHCDHGIGVVYKARNSSRLSLTLEQISGMSFNDLTGDTKGLLNLRKPADLTPILKQLQSERQQT